MKVLKFGGTSLGNASKIKEVAKLVNNSDSKIVVLSAMSGTTNELVEIANKLYENNYTEAKERIDQLEQNYLNVVDSLFTTSHYKKEGLNLISSHFHSIKSYTKDILTVFEEKSILAHGELISTALFHYYLSENHIKSVLLPALNFMRTDKDGEPDLYYIKENLNREINSYPDDTLFVTQGFISRNNFGEIDNLKRGGSDYTASLIGVAIQASEIQIWTDIDGMHNNDPRIIENTKPLAHISFEEAAELAYFGAKILHPASINPAKTANIPVRLKNTMQPESFGTLITSRTEDKGIKAIAAKDDITVIKIKSGRMLLAYGFMRKVFEIFEIYKTSIDMITTSEVAVSITIDDAKYLDDIVSELQKYGTVEVEKNHTIICVVGDFIAESKGYAGTIFRALNSIPVRMISYGGSSHNVSILVEAAHKKEALTALNSTLEPYV
ncbi:aspartate kinase [Aequorivita sp. KMM 9714]|uniref:aspartate kinase n=1 Tax=Aequorivita sp. KMM 9714 TaxID=2707173 RepID=UPI0013ECAB28|nr:aspartate kinase [Aequorivita sp. KMM 9714]NGX85395.1 aspartate kinase [Aequorivita sp. KMM 9714]